MFNDLNKGITNIHGLDSKDLSGIFDRYDIKESRKDLEEFLKSWDGVGDISQSYQKWMADNGKATSTFSSITKKAGTALKSFGAALGSMVVMYVISEIIGRVISEINKFTEAAANAKEGSEALTQKMKDFDSSVGENAKKLKELNSRYQEVKYS